MEITLAKQLQKWSAKLATKLLGRFLAPVNVFKITGIMPYVEAPTAPDILRAYVDTPLFNEPPPPSPSGQSIWSTSLSQRFTKTCLASVPGGIALPTGAVFDRHGQFLEQASHDYEFADKLGKKRHGVVLRPHRFLPNIHGFPHEVVSLTASNQEFYFHWIFDVLPRLRLAQQAGYGSGPFFANTELPFQQQTLQMLGVTKTQLIDPCETGAISTSNLIVPCHRVMPGHVFPKWLIDFLRDNFLPKLSKGQRPSPKRVYVSRRNASHRRVINEPEIISSLSRYGFQPIQAEELSFYDQVTLFRDAEIIIAPHGGGLANLVFCAPETKVIELFPSVNIDLYYRLATQLQLDYRFVKSRDKHGSFMGPNDYHIDLVELKIALGINDPGGFIRTTPGSGS